MLNSILVFAYIYMNRKILRCCCMEISSLTHMVLTRLSNETKKRGDETLNVFIA
jgi:hypothetical protein